jgi:hypothetical protein
MAVMVIGVMVETAEMEADIDAAIVGFMAIAVVIILAGATAVMIAPMCVGVPVVRTMRITAPVGVTPVVLVLFRRGL